MVDPAHDPRLYSEPPLRFQDFNRGDVGRLIKAVGTDDQVHAVQRWGIV